MPVAVKRMLLVTQNVPFAIDVKRALEALGEYSVVTAANTRNAIEFLRDNPADLLLLDTADLPISSGIMIELARARAADIAIVLAPDSGAVRQLAEHYAAKGVVDIPVLARDLIPVLDSALATRPDTLPPLEATSPQPSQDTLAIESLVDDLTADDSALNYTRRRLQASYELLHPPADEAASTARSLVEVEIAPPDESDTVRYSAVSMADDIGKTTMSSGNGDTVRDLAQKLAADPEAETELPAADYHDHMRNRDAFQRMLDELLDESTQLDDLKIDSLFDTTAELPGALGTGAVPAWLRLTEQFIDEPGFLDDMLPRFDDETDEPADTTEPADLQAIAEPAPVPAHDEETVPSAETETATAAAFRPVSSEQKDPLVAQLALTMTQAMTELTADGTVLTRGKRIHAYAGELPLDKLRALRRVISDDWAARGESSRVRFVRIPDDSADYLLYSRATIADYCLTMIFSGGKQLREIRQQGESLATALESAPTSAHESETADEPASATEAIETQPFAFVWLLADVDLPLSKPVAQQLLFWLELQLNALGWTIHRLDVHGDFIHLYADVPGDASPDALIRDVMERSRQIACAEDRGLPGDLWADAYLVVQPGRAISERELGRFLQFARA